jgi:hypothetical protein
MVTNREPDEFDPEHLQAKACPGARARRDRVGDGRVAAHGLAKSGAGPPPGQGCDGQPTQQPDAAHAVKGLGEGRRPAREGDRDAQSDAGVVLAHGAWADGSSALGPDRHELIWLAEEAFASAFAQHASAQEQALLAAAQRPLAAACIRAPALRPAWKVRPSWFLVAEEDRMIPAETQRFMAERMKARVYSAPATTYPWSRRRPWSSTSCWKLCVRSSHPSTGADEHGPIPGGRAGTLRRLRSGERRELS